jgi:GDP-4-dehydro-6-deoxy-D-mannose reductase
VTSLITGAQGFVGLWLTDWLLSQGETVFGVSHRPAPFSFTWSQSGGPENTILPGDLRSREEALALVEQAAPDRVYHLAAMSSVPESFDDPIGTLHNNLAAQINVLEAVRALTPQARVLVVSSSEIYGRVQGGKPLDEDAPLRPENPYAVSKAAQDLLAYEYGVAHGLDIVRVRAFNHIGPGQSDRFVASSFARQIAEIEVGKRDPVLHVGNLEARRDFTDVRDIVRAYELAMLSGEKGAVYNLGSGIGVPIQRLLDLFVERSRVPVRVEVAQDRVRSVDAPLVLCDCTRFRERTGWVPAIPLETTVEDILTYWRAELAS